jgi:hypothetical protein
VRSQFSLQPFLAKFEDELTQLASKNVQDDSNRYGDDQCNQDSITHSSPFKGVGKTGDHYTLIASSVQLNELPHLNNLRSWCIMSYHIDRLALLYRLSQIFGFSQGDYSPCSAWIARSRPAALNSLEVGT